MREPRGEFRDDLRVAKQTGDIAGMLLGKSASGLSLRDFLLDFHREERAEPDLESTEAALKSLVANARR